MKRIAFIASLALALVALSASSASIITKPVNVDPFDQIVTKGKFDIKYYPGDQSVKICGPQAAVDKFSLQVVNGVLTIDSGKTTFIRNDKLVVYVSTPTLKGVRIEGAGDFEADRGVVGKNVELTVAGAGDIDVKRLEAETVKISINGAGDIDLENTSCETLEIIVNGAGEADIEGLECRKLDANINGAGSADLSGHAQEATIILNGAGGIDISELRCDNINSQINGIGKIKRY